MRVAAIMTIKTINCGVSLMTYVKISCIIDTKDIENGTITIPQKRPW